MVLVARERDAAWLARQLEGDGPGRLCVVWGEAGVGKTRLADEVVAPSARRLTVTFPGGRFTEPGFGLRRLGAAAVPAAKGLRAALGEDAPADEPASPEQVAAVCRAANDVLGALAPGVVVLDDVQWADDLTLAWLASTAELFGSAPVRLVLLVRATNRLPGRLAAALAPLQRRGHVAIHQLRPFDVAGVKALSDAHDVDLEAKALEALHARTGGLPLAVEDLLLDARRRGQRSADIASAVHSGEAPVVAALVREQLAGLDDSARAVVELAALAPQPCPETLIRSTAGLDPATFDAAVEAASEAGLVTPPAAGVLRFRHELHRETVEADLPLAERRARHRRLADQLFADPGASVGDFAHHLLEAGAPEEALDWLEAAADEASAVADHGGALAHLGVALEQGTGLTPERAATLADRVHLAAMLTGRRAESDRLMDLVLAHGHPPAQRARLLHLKADLTDGPDRLAALTGAREAYTSVGDAVGQAQVLGDLAIWGEGTVPLAQRLAFGTEGLRLARAAGDASAEARCAVNLAATGLLTGDASATDLLAEAERTLERSGDALPEHVEALHRIHLATGAFGYGLHDDVRRMIDTGLQRLTTGPIRRALLSVSALLLWRLGRWREAGERADAALAEPLARKFELGARLVRAAIAAEQDPRPDLEPLVAAAGELRWPMGLLAQSLLMRERVIRREPRPERGLAEHLERVVGAEARVGWEDLLVVTAQLGPGPHRDLTATLGALTPTGLRAEAATLHARGLLAARAASPQGAVAPSAGNGSAEAPELLEAAAEAYDNLGEPLPAARALEAAGTALVASGRSDPGLRVRAAERYEALGAERSLAQLLRRNRGSRALRAFAIPERQAHAASPGLTPREQEVAELARLGDTAQTIAAELGLAPGTVYLHLQRIKRKLGVRTKAELVRALSDA